MDGGRAVAAAILATGIALGLGLAGHWVGQGLAKVRTPDRFVAVKGFAERDVVADQAAWPVTFQVTGDDLTEVYERLARDANAVRSFLGSRGISGDSVTRSAPSLTDFETQGGGPNRPPHRYLATTTLTARSSDVAAVISAMQESVELVKSGVALTRSYDSQPEFQYTRLDEIKPEMIAAATKNAREAADQFARDSGSQVGAIRTARQGFFTINDRDRHAPELKRVRVVTSVEYFLLD